MIKLKDLLNEYKSASSSDYKWNAKEIIGALKARGNQHKLTYNPLSRHTFDMADFEDRSAGMKSYNFQIQTILFFEIGIIFPIQYRLSNCPLLNF